MRNPVHFLSALLLSLSCLGMGAQTLPPELVYPDTLRAPNDSFSVYFHFPNSSGEVRNSLYDTGSHGTDGLPGRRMEFRTQYDTVSVGSVNTVHDQHLLIPVIGRTDTFLYRLRFNGVPQPLPRDYRETHAGRVTYAVPEVYELANVILYLSTLSDSTGNHPTGSDYHRAVDEHFGGMRNHALVRLLNRRASAAPAGFDLYYSFRENSFGFTFDEFDRLTPVPYHLPVYFNVTSTSATATFMEFTDLLYLVQDFAERSDFRRFYRTHAAYYADQVRQQRELMPVERMTDWLDNEFTDQTDHYVVIFSPLIGGSHSTRQFSLREDLVPVTYTERVMFVNGPAGILAADYDVRTKQALQSGIVFTEIDHNHVNPLTAEHIALVKERMSDLVRWNGRAGTGYYDSAYATFNEYLTHALFCLYVRETYPPEVADLVIERREALMERRAFPRFRAFNQAFMSEFARDKRTRPLRESYPAILSLLTTD
ncbi:DUF4932 domain-containing protein [Lewinella sp. JB7]|uniref:DUF4932 domain-containing protein n=1 Tax=Lewinella sp. JB7 TaxID=2962887 RepID=UPI0020C9C0CA|nr:DUF4932 domain-containing protein [Lewinella sp. JB7]MCP9235773.1 DUF4932 domain-containing protein [Lewinella sp. JB7]